MFARSLILTGALLIAACAIAPTQDMADARIALRTAEQAGAREYANMLLARSRRSLADAEAQLESGLYGGAQTNARKAASAALAAGRIAEEIAIAKRELAAAQQLNIQLPAAASAITEALAASAVGQEDAAIGAAKRASDIARSQIDIFYLQRARALRSDCQTEPNDDQLARADLELGRGRGAEAFEILQHICSAR